MFLKNIRATLAIFLLSILWATTALAAPPSYPFGARTDPYRYGIKPNHLRSSETDNRLVMDNRIKLRYDEWKANLVVDVPTVSGGKAVKFGSADYLTVSEGMGYGMLLTVIMAGHDAEAQTLFDGLLKTVRARPAYSVPDGSAGLYLMDWRLAADGSATEAAGGGWNAMDGDLDIAMALLMADRQWGSSGAWNYRQEAINTIGALKSWNMKADGTTKGCPDQHTSRTSDYMIGHFRAFGAATNDAFWSATAIDRSYALIDRMQSVYSPGVGLMPDFIVKTETSTPEPSPGGMCDRTATEMRYFANAQRNPWRWGTDYVFSGDARWKNVLIKMMTFFVQDNGGTPGPAVSSWEPIGNMAVGYHLNGTRMNSEFSNPWPAIGLVAGAMNGAQVDPSFQGYLNAAWDWLDAKWKPNYYDAELTLLSMIVASGNWWNPTAAGPTPTPTPTPTPGTSPPRIQGENGTLIGSGVSVKTDLAGYESTGFVGNVTTTGDQLAVTFDNVTAGSYDIRIRYHAWTDQVNHVSTNGTVRNHVFPATGSNWAVKTVSNVTLAAGSSTIAVIKNWGYIDVDYIEIVPAGMPTAAKLQAENGTVSGAGVGPLTDHPGFEGTAFIGNFTTNGDQLTMTFPDVVAGTYNINIRYHAWGGQQNNVVVNGAWRNEAFPATGSDWVVKTISGVALQGGTNTIAISKDWGYIDVDYVEIRP